MELQMAYQKKLHQYERGNLLEAQGPVSNMRQKPPVKNLDLSFLEYRQS